MQHDDSGPADRGGRVTPQLLVGLLVIAVGVLLTLDNLHLIEADDYLRFWPAGLIAIGVVKLWHARGGHGAFGGFLFAVIGSWLLLEQTALVRLSIWDVWPTLLVFFGGFLVWQGLMGPRPRARRTHATLVSGDTNDTVNAMAVLGSVVRGNNSPAFRGGELTAVMGGCELDLRNASIDGEAIVDIFALWGGIEIRVPDNWTVVSQVTPVLGGVDDKTRPPQGTSRQRLVLRGFVVMAGVEVKN
jgi:hypothetical protein